MSRKETKMDLSAITAVVLQISLTRLQFLIVFVVNRACRVETFAICD